LRTTRLVYNDSMPASCRNFLPGRQQHIVPHLQKVAQLIWPKQLAAVYHHPKQASCPPEMQAIASGGWLSSPSMSTVQQMLLLLLVRR
jgi:hypothetical protein